MKILSNAYKKGLKILLSQIIPQGSSSLKINYQTPKTRKKCDYIVLINTLSFSDDIQELIKRLKINCHPKTRIIVIYFNFLWKPILDIASKLGLRERDAREPNWLSTSDIENFFKLEGFESIKKDGRILLPIELGFFSSFINRFLSPLPFVNHLCLNNYIVFRQQTLPSQYSVSIIIPARNEEGNIVGILNKLPYLGSETEVIFVEGHSRDNTYKAIEKEISLYNGKLQCYAYKQKGTGKADAVRLGFRQSTKEILMILDADLTVSPQDLVKFYDALAQGYGDFANGSRLVYPQQKQAMRTLNYIGNKFFSLVFTYLLGQRVKDTLCGTKVLFKKDYMRIEKNRKVFGDFDPFGDFDLLFGATKLNLKIVEIPVRYKSRKYGTTNISRFTHGWLLLKMTVFAALRLKFI